MSKFWIMLAAGLLGASPALAQVQTIDPNTAIDSDLQTPPPNASTPPRAAQEQYPQQPAPPSYPEQYPESQANPEPAQTTPQTAAPAATTAQAGDTTYHRDDVISAAEGVFGKGAEGLAGIIENILRDQGEPNAYIAGREASGALVVGLRYGSGTLTHKIEGSMPIYWTGPSVGFDVGGDANKVFVLVYNLYDSHDIYKRFPAGEGRVYFVGGFSATYLRRGDIVLIPVRLGVGWRLGANVGYMKFSEKSRWFPF